MKNVALRLVAILGLGFAMSAGAASEDALNYKSLEGFGSAAFQSISPGGNSFAGGLHYTPSLAIGSNWAIKAFLGPQAFKSTASTGSKVYIVGDFLAALQWKPSDSAFVFNAGAGGGKDFRSNGVTRAAVLAGVEYNFREKFLGIFDRGILDGIYYLNSAKLIAIHYGLGINF